MHIEMRGTASDAIAQDTAALRVGLGRFQLELRAVELGGHVGKCEVGAQAIGGGQRRSATLQAGLQDLAAIPMRARARTVHGVSSTSCIFWYVGSVLRCEHRRLPARQDYTSFGRESPCEPGLRGRERQSA